MLAGSEVSEASVCRTTFGESVAAEPSSSTKATYGVTSALLFSDQTSRGIACRLDDRTGVRVGICGDERHG